MVAFQGNITNATNNASQQTKKQQPRQQKISRNRNQRKRLHRYLKAEHKAVCVDMRSLARSMGKRFHAEIERSVTSSSRSHSPATLRIQTGAPLSLFDPAAWVASCTEFFYGDCAPNLERPAKITWRDLFRYLMNREELEYHLPSCLLYTSDAADE